jgi:hypothetical protein
MRAIGEVSIEVARTVRADERSGVGSEEVRRISRRAGMRSSTVYVEIG